jgi:hypothetical protein
MPPAFSRLVLRLPVPEIEPALVSVPPTDSVPDWRVIVPACDTVTPLGMESVPESTIVPEGLLLKA